MTCCCRQLIEGQTGEAEVNPVVAAEAGNPSPTQHPSIVLFYLDWTCYAMAWMTI